MTLYRLYFLDDSRRVFLKQEVSCASDEEACRRAAEISKGRVWELWRGNARIAAGGGNESKTPVADETHCLKSNPPAGEL